MKAFPGAITAIIVVMALSSCTPQPEAPPQPRSTPVITPVVTSATAGPPGYIDCFGAPKIRPTELSLKCVDASIKLVSITWDGQVLGSGVSVLSELGSVSGALLGSGSGVMSVH